MSDKDKEAFEKWFISNRDSFFAVFLRENYPDVGIKWDREPARSSWQAACEYKQKEIDEYKEAASSEAFLVNELQVENAKLRECVEFYADLDEEAIGYDIRGVTYARQCLNELEEK